MQCCRCKPRCAMAQDVGALVLIANGELVTQELCAVPLHATVHCRRTGFVRRSVWCRCWWCQWGGGRLTGWFFKHLSLVLEIFIKYISYKGVCVSRLIICPRLISIQIIFSISGQFPCSLKPRFHYRSRKKEKVPLSVRMKSEETIKLL